MAWNVNRKDSVSTMQTPNLINRHKTFSRYYVTIGLFTLTLIFVAVIYLFINHNDLRQSVDPSSNNKLTSFPTNSVSLNIKEETSTYKDDMAAIEPQKVGELRNGYRLLANGKLHKVYGIVTNDLSNHRAKSSIFKRRCENIIAGLIASKPGTTMVGEFHFNGAFAKDFFESLSEPIEINADDSDYDKNLKSLVIEAKQNLLEAANRGEDIEKIIIDSRKECQELARYKQVLEKDIYEYIMKKDVSDDDIDTYVEAANLMLEEKGIAPINPGPISRIKLKVKEGDLQ